MAKRPGFASRFRHGEDGAAMVEYALILVFMALAIIGTVAALGSSLAVPFQQSITGLS